MKMEAKAVAKYVRMSPIKLKPVTDLVRGKDLNEALNFKSSPRAKVHKS
ncbi:MAG: large ribosomal subunit protein uL22 [Anaerovoracaceae bacterium]